MTSGKGAPAGWAEPNGRGCDAQAGRRAHTSDAQSLPETPLHHSLEILTRQRNAMAAGGWAVLPVCEAAKAPLFAGWPAYRYDPASPEPVIPRTKNAQGEPTRIAHWGTGVRTVRIIAVDVDIDDAARAHAARVAFECVADAAGCVRYRSNSPRRMLFYGAGVDVPTISATFGRAPSKLEIFANHGGRQVMVFGQHPSGVMLQYEGDAPDEMAVSELPSLDRATLAAATRAALAAAGIEETQRAARRSVRAQPTAAATVGALADELLAITTGASVHNSSNALADLLVFQIGLDAEQAAAVLAAVADLGRRLNPTEAERYVEMASKACSRAGWYVERIMEPPGDPERARAWCAARERQLRRAWLMAPQEVRDQFLDVARAAHAL